MELTKQRKYSTLNDKHSHYVNNTPLHHGVLPQCSSEKCITII